MFAPLTLVAILASLALATDSAPAPEVTTVGYSWGASIVTSCVSGVGMRGPDAKYTDGTVLKHGACAFQPEQAWDVKYGIGPVKSFHQPDMCLDAGDMKEGTGLTTSTCDEGSPQQNWNVRQDGLFELVNSGLCISLAREAGAADVTLAQCNPGELQTLRVGENKNRGTVPVPTHERGEGGDGGKDDTEGGEGGEGDVDTGDVPKPKPHCKPKKRSLRSRK